MSFHQKSKFNITNHAIIRAKQRISSFKSLESDLFIRAKLLDILNQLTIPEFVDRKNKYSYFHIPNNEEKYLYIVVDQNNFVITVQKITHEKRIKLLS